MPVDGLSRLHGPQVLMSVLVCTMVPFNRLAPHAQCSRDRLWIHHRPDQDKQLRKVREKVHIPQVSRPWAPREVWQCHCESKAAYKKGVHEGKTYIIVSLMCLKLTQRNALQKRCFKNNDIESFNRAILQHAVNKRLLKHKQSRYLVWRVFIFLSSSLRYNVYSFRRKRGGTVENWAFWRTTTVLLETLTVFFSSKLL